LYRNIAEHIPISTKPHNAIVELVDGKISQDLIAFHKLELNKGLTICPSLSDVDILPQEHNMLSETTVLMSIIGKRNTVFILFFY